MKKISPFVLLLLAFCQQTIAQEGHGNESKPSLEISVSAGIWSSDELFDGYMPGFLLGPSFQNYTISQYSGAFSFAAKYFVSRRVSISIAFAYENESGGWQENINTNGDWQVVQLGTFKRQAFTFAPEVYFYYVNKGTARFYCTGGLGITYSNEVDKYSDSYYSSAYNNGINSLGPNEEFNNNKMHPNFYLSPLGFSIGGAVRWFGEIGIGYKGVFNTGLSVKL